MNGSVKNVSDRELLRRLAELVKKDRSVEADLLAHLGEVEARHLYLAEGCSSMYDYCTEILHLSEWVAYFRLQTARAARKFPVILARLRRGEINLSGVKILAPQLTKENHVELLDRARHKNKLAIKELVADLAPKPDAPSVVRKLPEIRTPIERSRLEPPLREADAQAATATEPEPLPPAPPALAPGLAPRYESPEPEPLGRERYKIQFTASRELRDKLHEAQALLRHQIPRGELAKIFDRALTLLVEDVKRKRFAQTSQPRQTSPAAKADSPSRHIPAAIKRAVYARDGGSCAFVGRNGRRCRRRDFLELHHLDPWARSERHTAERIELRCWEHNHYEAERDYGAAFMARFRKGGSVVRGKTGSGTSNGSSHPNLRRAVEEAPTDSS